MNFTNKIIALEDEARNFILSKLKDGETIELISSEDLEVCVSKLMSIGNGYFS
jgi:hypothetical protein